MYKRCQKTALMMCFVFTVSLRPVNQCRAENVRWATDVEAALRTAGESDRLVLMKFTADWCGYCKKMERTTFTVDSVADLVNGRFVPVLVDADQHKDLVTHLKIKGLPALLVVSPDMMILERITGYQTADKLLPKLNQALIVHQPAQPARTANEGITRLRPSQPMQFARPVSRPSIPELPAPEIASPNPFDDGFAPVAPDTPANQARPRPVEDNPFAQYEAQTQRQSFDNAATENAAISGAATANPFADLDRVVDESPKPAFDGLCLTSVVEERRLVAGRPEFTTTYRGRLLTFESEQQKRKFTAAPEKYWPMLDGACPLTLLQSGRRVTGEVRHAAVFRQRVWLLQSPELMQEFITDPARYVDRLQ